MSLRRPKSPSKPPSVSKPNRGSAGTGVAGATGVTLLLAEEAALVPKALVAVTVNVYAVPLVSPVTSHVSASASLVVQV